MDFGNRIVYPYTELDGVAFRTAAQSFFQFVSDLKHLVGIREREPAGFGQFEPSSNA